MNKIALLGSNVSKSPSPKMQNTAFKYFHLPYFYEAISIPENSFEEKFSQLKKEYCGFNITIPFKEKAIHYLDKLSPTAQRLQAVNTVILENGEWCGENTDVWGFFCAVSEAGVSKDSVKAKPAFILGAGGAAKATVEALSQLGCRHFILANRTPKRLEQFSLWFQKNYPESKILSSFLLEEGKKKFQESLLCSFLFANTAPLEACKTISFFSEIEFPTDVFCVDWVYLPIKTFWLQKARKFVEGYKILLFQGMKAFHFWTKKEAPREVMEKALLENLS
jgi:shikimate dehydrogenase